MHVLWRLEEDVECPIILPHSLVSGLPLSLELDLQPASPSDPSDLVLQGAGVRDMCVAHPAFYEHWGVELRFSCLLSHLSTYFHLFKILFVF